MCYLSVHVTKFGICNERCIEFKTTTLYVYQKEYMFYVRLKNVKLVPNSIDLIKIRQNIEKCILPFAR